MIESDKKGTISGTLILVQFNIYTYCTYIWLCIFIYLPLIILSLLINDPESVHLYTKKYTQSISCNTRSLFFFPFSLTGNWKDELINTQQHIIHQKIKGWD